MLATLAIPIPVSLSETEKHLELDEIAREKSRRLAGLLGLQSIPTRTSLINDMVGITFSGVSISTDVRRRASASSIRDVGYFLPKLK